MDKQYVNLLFFFLSFFSYAHSRRSIISHRRPGIHLNTSYINREKRAPKTKGKYIQVYLLYYGHSIVDLPRARLNADQKRKESKMFQARQLGATLKNGK
jgi:hypothetical protein